MFDSNAAGEEPQVEIPDPDGEGAASEDPASRSEDFENAEVDDLKADVPVAATPESIRAPNGKSDVRKLVLELQRTRFQKTQQSAEINRLHQQNEMRPKFFWMAASLTWFIIVANSIIVGYYVWHAKEAVNHTVLIYWIGSTVVEILGIVYIIAQYLFPGAKKSDSGSKDESQ